MFAAMHERIQHNINGGWRLTRLFLFAVAAVALYEINLGSTMQA